MATLDGVRSNIVGLLGFLDHKMDEVTNLEYEKIPGVKERLTVLGQSAIDMLAHQIPLLLADVLTLQRQAETLGGLGREEFDELEAAYERLFSRVSLVCQWTSPGERRLDQLTERVQSQMRILCEQDPPQRFTRDRLLACMNG